MATVLTMFSSFLLAHAGGASAGGWWSEVSLPNSHLEIGETVHAHRSEIIFDSVEDARRAVAGTERSYVYLVPRLDWRMVDRAMANGDPGAWWEPPAAPIRLAPVRFTDTDANLAAVEATFTVPDVDTGAYAVMYCTDGCRTPLGNTVPTRAVVAADELSAETALGLARLRSRVASEVSELSGDLSALTLEVKSRVGTIASGQVKRDMRMEALERRLAALTGQVAATRSRATWLLGAVGILGVLLAGLCLLVVRQRARNQRHPHPFVVPDFVELEEVGAGRDG